MSWILPRVKSWSEALKQPRRPVLISLAPVTTGSHPEICIVGYHLGLCCPQGPWWSKWPAPSSGAMESSGPGLLPWAMSNYVTLLQPGSVLMSEAPDNIKGRVDARDLAATSAHFGFVRHCCCRGTCQYEWPMLQPGTMVTLEPRLFPKTLSFFHLSTNTPWSVLTSLVHVATKNHMDAPGLGCSLWP